MLIVLLSIICIPNQNQVWVACRPCTANDVDGHRVNASGGGGGTNQTLHDLPVNLVGDLTALLDVLFVRSAGGNVVPPGGAFLLLPLARVSPAADDADALHVDPAPACKVVGVLEDEDSSGLTPSR